MEIGLKLSTKSNSPLVDETQFRQLVGSLIYLTATRPDLSFAASYISRLMMTPRADHWVAAKRVLRYVKGTSDYGLLYTRSDDLGLSGFIDSDWICVQLMTGYQPLDMCSVWDLVQSPGLVRSSRQ